MLSDFNDYLGGVDSVCPAGDLSCCGEPVRCRDGGRGRIDTNEELVRAEALSCCLAILAVEGAAAILTGRAVLARTDTALAAQGTPPVQKQLAAGHVQKSSTG
ncbi:MULTISPECIES: hypothetical protein [Streptomyces]|uniref:hypothetical protein n=1 Tax=Streptomyces TaxID=1883 RepID=UPI00381CCB26|nr:hypothetical protein OG855_04455 [Streptomyces anthocyanicus]